LSGSQIRGLGGGAEVEMVAEPGTV
jgi:hypothetical protein